MNPVENWQIFAADLATAVAPQMLAAGMDLWRGLSLIVIVWTGTQMALAGGGVNMASVVKMIITLSIPLGMLQFYTTPLPGLSLTVPDVITGMGSWLHGVIVAGAGEQMLTELQNMFRGMYDNLMLTPPAPGIMNPIRMFGALIAAIMSGITGLIFWVLMLLVMLVVYTVGLAQIVWAQLAITIALLLGPVFIPFLVLPPLSFLFWGLVQNSPHVLALFSDCGGDLSGEFTSGRPSLARAGGSGAVPNGSRICHADAKLFHGAAVRRGGAPGVVTGRIVCVDAVVGRGHDGIRRGDTGAARGADHENRRADVMAAREFAEIWGRTDARGAASADAHRGARRGGGAPAGRGWSGCRGLRHRNRSSYGWMRSAGRKRWRTPRWKRTRTHAIRPRAIFCIGSSWITTADERGVSRNIGPVHSGF